jgi:hypothetical protein
MKRLSVLALVAGAAGCLPTPVYSVEYNSSPLLLAQFAPGSVTRRDAETASATLPPGTSACSAGSYVLGTGKNDRYARSAGLGCLGNASCFSPADQTAKVPPGTIQLPTSAGSGSSCSGLPTAATPKFADSNTDHVVVRTTTAGELVRVVLGVGKKVPTAPPCNVPVTRNIFFVDTSSDCGSTWTSRALIDDGTSSFDRQELYRDPWEGNLYITAIGPNGQELFRSKDRGVSWSSAKTINNDTDRPIVMTSFPKGSSKNGRLLFFTCVGAKPTVIWSDDLGNSFSDPVSLLDVDTALPQCGMLPNSAFNPQLRNVLSISVGRSAWSADTDYAHVIYPTVTSANGKSRQDAVVANVSLLRKENKVWAAVMIQQIIGTNNASIWRSHLIDADRWGYTPDETKGDANVALIHWYEVTTPSSGTGKMRQRGEVLRGASTFSKVFDLSLSGGSAKSWTAAPLIIGTTPFYGHYDYGSFYMNDNKFNFFVHWSESSSLVSGSNMYLYGNVVQVTP